MYEPADSLVSHRFTGPSTFARLPQVQDLKGVDVARFRDAVPIARWQDGRQNILFFGRLEDRKGLIHLLRAHRILRKTGCDCRLLVAGSGPQARLSWRGTAGSPSPNSAPSL